MAFTTIAGRYNWIKVYDVMTDNPLTMSPTETVGQADEFMAENNIRQIPVIRNGELVGIVTDRDIRSFLNSALSANPASRENALNTKIDDIMTTEPVCVTPDDDLHEVVEMLIEQKYGAIPVVEAQRLVGIVSYIDVLRCFLNRLQEEL